MRGIRNSAVRPDGGGGLPNRDVRAIRAWRERGVTLEMLVGLVEQVSVGPAPYLATDRMQSLYAFRSSLALVVAMAR